MAGILDHQGIFYQLGVLSTEQFRDSILGRNLPPPVNETLTQSGLVSKLEDIGKVINVPIFGTTDENIPIHYNEDEKMFPLGTFYRTTQNVNLNPYSPQDDEYITYNLTIPPNLPKPQPEGFGERDKIPYPISYSTDRFVLINDGDKKGVPFPFNVIDTYKSLNFQSESSLGLVGGQQLEKTVIDKIAQVEDEMNPNTDSTGFITEPVGNMVNDYVDTIRGNKQFFNTLPNDAVGWNEYNSSNKINGGTPDSEEGVEPTMGVEIRMGSLLERTSVSQVQFTFDLLNRNPYRPLYNDRRLQGTSDEGTNGRYYIGNEKNTNRGPLVTKTFDSSDFNGDIDTSGNSKRTTIEGVSEPFGEPNKFFWTTGGEQNFNEKTLLYKTQQIVNNSETEVFINQTKKFFKDKKQDRLISRGNAISPLALIDAEANGNYCRVWTVNDRYSYFNAIRNTGLFTSPDGLNGFSTTSDKSSLSVLMDNGIPKYHPVKADSKTTRKKFMFSLENLAWADNLADLPLWEIGPGDPISGTKGRMMWFPPYDLKFDENTSANWTKTDFIGRSEPVYTYNNSVRSGSLSFKIIVDHPRVINCYKGQSNDLVERFFAGCVTPDDFLRALECDQSQTNFAEIEKKLNETKRKEVTLTETKTATEDVFFKTECVSANQENVESCATSTNVVTESLNNTIKKIREFIDVQSTETVSKTVVNLDSYCGLRIDALFKSKFSEVSPEQYTREQGETVREAIISGLSDLTTEKLNSLTIKVTPKGNVDTDEDKDYRVTANIETDIENSKEANENDIDKTGIEIDPLEAINLVDNLIIDESSYFEYIDANYPNYFKYISEKIKYFQPGYHSMTPEGLNSRLTFLNQCMKQGPSIYDGGAGIQPQNLSFGRPPICILRIGDFFHTKIAINSLSISYEGGSGIQYDLNPEGIGVQPMMANIQLSIDLIGGNTLSGPINRLQNAVSFNYYANTEIYDVRSDSVVDGFLQEGLKLGEIKQQLVGQQTLSEIYDGLQKSETINQVEQNENLDGESEPESNKFLELVSTDNKTIISKTVTGKPLSELKLGKSGDTKSIIIKVKVGSEDKEYKGSNDGSIVTTTDIFTDPDFKDNIVNPTSATTLNGNVETAQTNLTNAENAYKANRNSSALRIDVKNKQKLLSDQQAILDKYLDGKTDKVEVETYIFDQTNTKIFKRTKIKKTFTVTENGLT